MRRSVRAIAALAFILAGCQPALHPPALVAPAVTAAHDAKALRGRIVAGYATQATPAELVGYATVTLTDGANQVVATGLTDGTGAFGLNPFVAWTPAPDQVYVLDALKSFDATNDRAGLRFRTLVSWDGSQWRSLCGTSAAPAGIQLSTRTTALASIQSLRSVTASQLLGTLDPATGAFTETGGVTSGEVATVLNLVEQAIASNLDPVAYLNYDGTYRLRVGAGSRAIFDLEDAMGQSVNTRTTLRGRDGGSAYAFGPGLAQYVTQLGSHGSGAGQFDLPMGVDADRYGNVYVADHQNHRIQKFSADGRYLTTYGSQGSGSVQFNFPTDVRVDNQGNMLVSDYKNHRVQKIDPFGNLIFGLGGGGRWTGAAPAWTTARSNGVGFFHDPHYAKFDTAGNLWISDSAHHRILKYDPNGNFVLGIGGGTRWTTPAQPNSLKGLATANYVGTVTWGAAVARNTDGIATDGTYAYIHDGNSTNGGFFKVRISDGAVIAGPGSTPYLNSQGGSMAYVNGRLYYRGSGTGANKLAVIDPTTMSEVGYLLQNGGGTLASTNNDAHPWPTTVGWMTWGLTTDGRYLYIPSDTSTGTTFTVRVYDPFNDMAWVRDVVCAVPAGLMNMDHHAYYANGDYLFLLRTRTEAANIYKFRLSDGAYLGAAAYYDPLTANPTPACFDYVNQRIFVQDHGSNRFTTFGSSCEGTGDGWFNFPVGFAVSPNGTLYVCDRYNDRIQMFDASGAYLTQWGTPGTGNDQLDWPEDIALDQAGNLWVSETHNHRIHKFDRNGVNQGTYGSQGAQDTQLDTPRGMAQAPDGSILVGDWGNHRVVRIQSVSGPLIGPSKGYFDAARGTISCWFKPTWSGTDPTSRVFFRENGTNNGFGLHKMGSQFYLYVTDNTTDATRALRVGLAAADTARLIKAGEWHHLAVTWDGAAGQVHFYLNGTEYRSYATNLGTPMAFGTSGMISVGSEPDTSLSCSSVLDDFRIFDYPKSAEEILRDYRGLVQE